MSSDFPSNAYSAAQEKWLGRDHLITPTIRKQLEKDGGLEKKRILDVGCGNGHYSRDLITWGASEVLGIDNSEEMIKQCRSKNEEEGSERIKYEQSDISDKNGIGKNDKKEFHIATAFFVLQFIHEKEKLKQAIRNISDKLCKGGVLYALIPNGVDGVRPPEDMGQKLGASISRDWSSPFVDGELVKINFYEENKVCGNALIARHSRQFYEECLKHAGFENIEWIDPHFTDYAVSILGQQFCHQFLSPPCDIMFKAVKKA